ncbi:MAG: hypothetical protein H0T78_05800 [Longispora sp.]|nr:hypothetical protein [Longispora sp. (in: high G+C Gram-positive bacteria)]
MLGLRRNNSTRKDLIAGELEECRVHLREVASIIAESAAERLGPRIEIAKDKVNPTVGKARGAALHGLESMTVALGGKPQKQRNWSVLAGALGIGVIAGAVGALVMQRKHSRWDEYEPVQIMGMDMEEPLERAKSAAHDMGEKMYEAGDKLRSAAGNAKDTARDAASTAKNAAQQRASTAKHVAKNGGDTLASGDPKKSTRKP